MEKQNKSYIELLKDPRWQKKRLEVLSRDNFCCQNCFSETITLHVHHLKYNKGKVPWEIDSCYLITLCEDCHSIEPDSFKQSCDELIELLKQKGFVSYHLQVLISALKHMPYKWGSYEPNGDILKLALSKEEWDKLSQKFWDSFNNG